MVVCHKSASLSLSKEVRAKVRGTGEIEGLEREMVNVIRYFKQEKNIITIRNFDNCKEANKKERRILTSPFFLTISEGLLQLELKNKNTF